MIRKILYFSLLATIMIITSCKTNSETNKQAYYIDSQEGNDDNDGRSEKSAWKTLKKVNEHKFVAGDQILFKRSASWNGEFIITSSGDKEKPIIVSAYGTGERPAIIGNDSSMYAVKIYNAQYVQLNDLAVINTGKERLAGRTGVKVEINNFGNAHSIVLNNLEISDVNGSLVKQEGGGSGILIINEGKEKISVFKDLIIENCIIRRCSRNAIIFGSGYAGRENWNPSTGLIVRNNLIEEVPGDGIVPIGYDGALIEYNVMRNCPDLLPDTEAAAGIWPWSCDNTLVQFNEVSDHKAPWDAQGFDSDWNCKNTIIQYNYSHDNEGGFALICNDGYSKGGFNGGNKNTIIRYNLSINDGIRQKLTRSGIFSPTIHVAGPTENTTIENNIFYVNKKPAEKVDRAIVKLDSWGGFADKTAFKNNIFFMEEQSEIVTNEATNNLFENNTFYGSLKKYPEGNNVKKSLSEANTTPADLTKLLVKESTNNKSGHFVDSTAIHNYFDTKATVK